MVSGLIYFITFLYISTVWIAGSEMDRVRLCSSISKENTWYPIASLVSLGVTIQQLLDRIPLVLRLMKRLME